MPESIDTLKTSLAEASAELEEARQALDALDLADFAKVEGLQARRDTARTAVQAARRALEKAEHAEREKHREREAAAREAEAEQRKAERLAARDRLDAAIETENERLMASLKSFVDEVAAKFAEINAAEAKLVANLEACAGRHEKIRELASERGDLPPTVPCVPERFVVAQAWARLRGRGLSRRMQHAASPPDVDDAQFVREIAKVLGEGVGYPLPRKDPSWTPAMRLEALDEGIDLYIARYRALRRAQSVPGSSPAERDAATDRLIAEWHEG